MERSLFYLMLAVVGVYLIYSDLYTDNRPVSKIVKQMNLPDIPNLKEIGQSFNPFARR